MLKFQRNYYAEFKIIETDKNNEVINEEVLTISYPTTINFDIHIGGLNSNNAGNFQFYNLSPQAQAKLWRDIYNNGSKKILMTLYAGYNNTMPMVFEGWVQSCTSYKQSGSVDWVTDMQAFIAGEMFQNGYVNATFSKDTTLVDVINFMLESDSSIKIGAITPDIPPLPRNKTFIGQTLDLLGREYGNYDIIIDKGKLHILGDNDVIKGDLLVITDETGLLGSPRRSNAFVECDLLFEPQLKIGQAISLQAESWARINKSLNQAYKVVALHHYGMISSRICGSLKTTVTLSALETPPRTVEEAKPTVYESKNVTTAWSKPVSGGRITSPFGLRERPTAKGSTNHQGIDIGVPLNTPVYAPANGKVTFANWYGGYGKCVQLNNGTINDKAVSSLYGHLNSWAVKVGDTVMQGQTIIGYVGSTGVSTGPHLHFEVRENGAPVNPNKYIGSI